MPSVFVLENIQRIEDAIKNFREEISNLNERKKELTTEITRLEGCLLTFRGFNQAGIEEIIPEHEKNYNGSKQGCDQAGIEEIIPEHEKNSNGSQQGCDQEKHKPPSDPRVHTHEKESDKTPLEELYKKYRTM
jgi:hypothetical protein